MNVLLFNNNDLQKEPINIESIYDKYKLNILDNEIGDYVKVLGYGKQDNYIQGVIQQIPKVNFVEINTNYFYKIENSKNILFGAFFENPTDSITLQPIFIYNNSFDKQYKIVEAAIVFVGDDITINSTNNTTLGENSSTYISKVVSIENKGASYIKLKVKNGNALKIFIANY